MERALVVAVETRATRETLEAELAEFEALGQAAGAAIIGRVVQRRDAIDRAQDRLAGALGVLRARGANPVVIAADDEVASAIQNGGLVDQFAALGAYWSGYVEGRVLAALGGFSPVSSNSLRG